MTENNIQSLDSIQDIKNIIYINLDSRPDRKSHVEKELNKIGLEANRLSAVKMMDGAFGCSLSHLCALKIAQFNDWEHVLIVEDDILFTNPELFVTQTNKFLTNHKDFDVLLIAGNNMGQYFNIDESCIKITKCQTTTGYLVKKHYYNILIENFSQGIQGLVREPHNRDTYAIDQFWTYIQTRDKWFLIIPLSVTQRPDYSDIERKPTNYAPVMLDLDKELMKKHLLMNKQRLAIGKMKLTQ